MCLSTVYSGEIAPENVMMTNVQRIKCEGGTIFLTDIMERERAVDGVIELADLVGGKVVIKTA